jgi:hypothetical protein
MNSIDATKKEREILRNIALKLFPDGNNGPKSRAAESPYSYYLPASQDPAEYLRTYSFATIAELRAELAELWPDEETGAMRGFIPVVLAAAFKERPKADEEQRPAFEHKDEGGENILPTYIYTL